MSPLASLLIGIGGTVLLAVIREVFQRGRTKSEASHDDASSADLLSQAAARLAPLYEAQVALSVRLSKAEATAEAALAREALCLSRIVDLQTQVDELRRQIEQPSVTTITATAVTSHPPADPPVAS